MSSRGARLLQCPVGEHDYCNVQSGSTTTAMSSLGARLLQCPVGEHGYCNVQSGSTTTAMSSRGARLLQCPVGEHGYCNAITVIHHCRSPLSITIANHHAVLITTANLDICRMDKLLFSDNIAL